jgi:hypothetical protein
MDKKAEEGILIVAALRENQEQERESRKKNRKAEKKAKQLKKKWRGSPGIATVGELSCCYYLLMLMACCYV